MGLTRVLRPKDTGPCVVVTTGSSWPGVGGSQGAAQHPAGPRSPPWRELCSVRSAQGAPGLAHRLWRVRGPHTAACGALKRARPQARPLGALRAALLALACMGAGPGPATHSCVSRRVSSWATVDLCFFLSSWFLAFTKSQLAAGAGLRCRWPLPRRWAKHPSVGPGTSPRPGALSLPPPASGDRSPRA